MTYVDDLHEPGDDREPEPDERWAPGVVPVDLDEVEQRIERLRFLAPPVGIVATRAELNGSDDLADLRELIGHDVPGLIADLREARERLARWEALPTTDEWAVTDDRSTPPRDGIRFTADAALAVAARDGRQAWRQTRIAYPAVIRPWEPIDAEPPF